MPLNSIIVPRRLFFTALQWISHRPRSQNTAKERTLIPEKDSKRKRPRSHVSLEKSSKNYKPLEKWAKPNLLPDVTPQPANGNYFRRVCHVVESNPPEFLAVFSCHTVHKVNDWLHPIQCIPETQFLMRSKIHVAVLLPLWCKCERAEGCYQFEQILI